MTKTTTLKKVYVRPVEGRRIRDPKTAKPLPAEGGAVVWDSFWARRKRDGDVEVLKHAPAKKPAKKPETQKSEAK